MVTNKTSTTTNDMKDKKKRFPVSMFQCFSVSLLFFTFTDKHQIA